MRRRHTGGSSRLSAWGALPLAALAIAVAGCGAQAPACIGGQRPAANASAAEQPISQSSPDGALALKYQPTVMMSKYDGFWPVSLATVLNGRGVDGGRVVLHSPRYPAADPATFASLNPSDAPTSYLEYPAGLADKKAQVDAFLRGIGVPESTIDAWPTDLTRFVRQTGQIYFYDAGSHCSYPGASTVGYHALQYWFFYGLNYYPLTIDTAAMLAHPTHTDTADIDFHEGDWEHVTVLLDQQGTPSYVWMARHSSEGVLIPWDQVQHDQSGHPVVYPAFGGHPSYPDCGAHPRALLAAAVYDYVACKPGLYTLSASVKTPLVDLAQVSWSCWPGHFGTTVGTTASNNADDPTGSILVGGPSSPLQQAENKGLCSSKPTG